ncbi:MAG: sigma-54-dependent Fis family transcriptional regulator [Acidobacteria bacterium]|nr:sigma-54-dependent Fis family transcriptional regulator [Acidobacteriota bacterium]
MKKLKILLIEDNKDLSESLREFIEKLGYEPTTALTGQSGLNLLLTNQFQLALLDLNLPDLTGLEILEKIQDKDISTPIIIMTGFHSVESAVKAMKLGAEDYLKKPLNALELKLIIEKILEKSNMEREISLLQSKLGLEEQSDKFIGYSDAMKEVLRIVDKVAKNDQTTILLTGESGTGKTVIARIIHDNSPRKKNPFINVTCSAISEQLLESELMGHKKGAFTDAVSDKRGLLELADTGTIFLDEIGDMSMNLQAKILRVLEDKTFRRVGGLHDITVDTRIIAATNRNLEELVKTNDFREDLYYRLNVIQIKIPPLREREEDIPLLVQYFLDKFNKDLSRKIKKITPAAMQMLKDYHWPGNLRELRNVIERTVLLANNDIIGADDLPTSIQNKERNPISTKDFMLPDAGIDLHEFEKNILLQALDKAGGNVSRAARYLSIGRDKMRYRLKKFGIDIPE